MSYAQCRDPASNRRFTETHTFLNCDEPRDFWISWNEGVIRVGQGTELGWNKFLSYASDTPLQINYFIVSTEFLNQGIWNINPCHVPPGKSTGETFAPTNLHLAIRHLS